MEAKAPSLAPCHFKNLSLRKSASMQGNQKYHANPFLLINISQTLKKAL